jgi:4-amino-4-deoxy-L-arabinose transferase-like glycosyltransferase
MKDKIKLIPFLLLIFVALWLRLVNLGYSDYYGDEIRAMWRPAPGQSTTEYLYSQRKGPTEFLVSYLVKVIDPNYTHEFLLRLPFALAGIVGIYIFYKLVRLHFGQKIALYASLLLSINGIFIGLMRSIQYQSFVILFSLLALYLFSLASLQERWKIRGIYLGAAAWTVALFSHYDGVFIAPFALYLLWRWYTQNADLTVSVRLKHLAVPFALSAMALAVYFIPYLLSIPKTTTDYWIRRIAEPVDIDIEKRSSLVVFDLYNPILALYIYPVLGGLSLPKIKKTLPVVIWFVFIWIILEIIIFDPGTHIYNYLIPATILVAFGLEVLEEALVNVIGEFWGKRVNILWLALLFGSLAAISHLIFVDHTPEYPFEKRRILLWTIGDPSREYKLWIYGFPYYRRWEDIRDYVTTTVNNGYYYTNEKDSISVFYIPLGYSNRNAGYYIYIHNPQNFARRESREKAFFWRTHYEPVKVFTYNNRVVAEIYNMPSGSLGDILDEGY